MKNKSIKTSPLLTVEQFIAKHPTFGIGRMRAIAAHALSDGSTAGGSVCCIDGEVLINETEFYDWAIAQNRKRGGAA